MHPLTTVYTALSHEPQTYSQIREQLPDDCGLKGRKLYYILKELQELGFVELEGKHWKKIERKAPAGVKILATIAAIFAVIFQTVLKIAFYALCFAAFLKLVFFLLSL